jgi:hypothetical protein
MSIYDRIAEVAYLIYEKNGKVDGRDFENWLEAERIVLGQEHTKEGGISDIPANKKKVTKRGGTRKSARAEMRI